MYYRVFTYFSLERKKSIWQYNVYFTCFDEKLHRALKELYSIVVRMYFVYMVFYRA